MATGLRGYRAGSAIRSYETSLTSALINGTGNLAGLRDMKNVTILSGADNPHREGTVSFVVEGVGSFDVVQRLNDEGIRTRARKADHYSGNMLDPLNLSDGVRITLCDQTVLTRLRWRWERACAGHRAT